MEPIVMGKLGTIIKGERTPQAHRIAALLWLSLPRGLPLLVVAIVAVVGAADELYQRFLPGRSAGLVDLAMDILAAAVMVALLEYARRRHGSPCTK